MLTIVQLSQINPRRRDSPLKLDIIQVIIGIDTQYHLVACRSPLGEKFREIAVEMREWIQIIRTFAAIVSHVLLPDCASEVDVNATLSDLGGFLRSVGSYDSDFHPTTRFGRPDCLDSAESGHGVRIFYTPLHHGEKVWKVNGLVRPPTHHRVDSRL